MKHNRTVQIFIEILDNSVEVLFVGLDQIYGSDSVKLFPVLFDMEVECDVVLPEIFHFEERGVYLLVESVKN